MTTGHAASAALLGEDLSGSSVERWQLRRRLGADLLTTYYDARDDAGHRSLLLVLHDEVARRVHSGDLAGLDHAFREELRRTHLVPHEGVFALLADGVTSTRAAFACLEVGKSTAGWGGESLGDYVHRRRGKVPPVEALRMTAEILAVMEAAHGAGVLHTALRPGHVRFMADGAVKLFGFGWYPLEQRVARSLGLPRSSSGVLAVPGSGAFTAPEQARTGEPSAAADLWAVGTLLFSLLLGEPPFAGADDSHQADRVQASAAPDLRQFSASCPEELAAIVARSLAPEPADRYESASAMERAVREAMARPELARLMALPRSATTTTTHPPASLERELPPAPPPDDSEETNPVSVRVGRTTSNLGLDAPRRTITPNQGVAAPRVGSAPVPLAPTHHRAAAYMTPVPPSLRQTPAGPRRETAQGIPGSSAPPPAEPMAASPAPRHHSIGTIASLRALGQLLDDALAQYLLAGTPDAAAGEPPTEDHRRELCEQLTRVVRQLGGRYPRGIRLQVTPFAFQLEGEQVWQPSGNLEELPRRLFDDGVRALRLAPEIDAAEFDRLLRLLSKPPLTGTGAVDDLATLLWDAALAKVSYEAVGIFDMTARKGQSELARSHQELLAFAAFDTGFLLEDSFEEAARELRRGGTPWRGTSGEFARASRTSSPGITSWRDLGTQVDAEIELDPGRLGFVLGSAYAGTADDVRPHLENRLHRTIKQEAARSPRGALDMIVQVYQALGLNAEGKALQAALSQKCLTADLLRQILQGGAAHFDAERLTAILEHSAPEQALTLVSVLCEHHSPETEPLLSRVVDRVLASGSQQLTTLMTVGEANLTLPLLQAVGAHLSLQDDEAIAAAAQHLLEAAASNEHPLISAVARAELKGLGDGNVRAVFRSLLGGPQEEDRIATLMLIGDFRVRAAGPFLAERVRSPVYHQLGVAEKWALMDTLGRIMETTGEALALELLTSSTEGDTAAEQESAELAATYLGRRAASARALERLEEVATSEPTERLRSAARRGARLLRERLEVRPP